MRQGEGEGQARCEHQEGQKASSSQAGDAWGLFQKLRENSCPRCDLGSLQSCSLQCQEVQQPSAGCWLHAGQDAEQCPHHLLFPGGMVKAEQWSPGQWGEKKNLKNQENALHGQLGTGEHPEASEISAPPKSVTVGALPLPSFTLGMSLLFSLCPVSLCLCAGMWSNKTSNKADGKFQFGSLLWKKKRSSSRKKK